MKKKKRKENEKLNILWTTGREVQELVTSKKKRYNTLLRYQET